MTGRTSTKVLNGELRVCKNNHESIISEETFREVAAKFQERSVKYSNGTMRKLSLDEDIYKDLVFCGLCGAKYTRQCCLSNRAGGKKARNYYYACSNKEKLDDRKCDNDKISLLALNRLLREALEHEFSLSSIKQKNLVEASQKQAAEEKEQLRKEITEISVRIERMKQEGSRDYIKYRVGDIGEEVLRHNTDMRKKSEEALLEKQKRLERKSSELDGEADKKNHYLRVLLKCRKSVPLSSDVVHTLIDRIEIFPGKRAVIHFKYSGKEIRDRKGRTGI